MGVIRKFSNTSFFLTESSIAGVNSNVVLSAELSIQGFLFITIITFSKDPGILFI